MSKRAEKASMVAIAMQFVTIQKDHSTVPTNSDLIGMAIIAAKVSKKFSC